MSDTQPINDPWRQVCSWLNGDEIGRSVCLTMPQQDFRGDPWDWNPARFRSDPCRLRLHVYTMGLSYEVEFEGTVELALNAAAQWVDFMEGI